MTDGDEIYLKRVDANGETVRLRLVDYGGVGRVALLLHGLAGAAHEWRDTAAWLSKTHHVYALDQRGHGGSSKGLASFARRDFVADVVATIEAITSEPVLLIGQSHGGVTAFLVAAQHLELVSLLIVIEAGIACDPDAPRTIARWLESWPLPFADRASAQIFFGGKSNAARVWSEMLEETADGWRPPFYCDDILASVRDGENVRDYADDWRRVACPTLIVVGESGWIGHEIEQMIALNGRAKAEVVPRAGHDVHLDTPDLWRSSVQKFLGEECAR